VVEVVVGADVEVGVLVVELLARRGLVVVVVVDDVAGGEVVLVVSMLVVGCDGVGEMATVLEVALGARRCRGGGAAGGLVGRGRLARTVVPGRGRVDEGRGAAERRRELSDRRDRLGEGRGNVVSGRRSVVDGGTTLVGGGATGEVGSVVVVLATTSSPAGATASGRVVEVAGSEVVERGVVAGGVVTVRPSLWS
jgi:hypothetical protein